MREHPVLTLMTVISAVLILVGRVNHEQSWGDYLFIAGIALLVVAGVLFLFSRR